MIVNNYQVKSGRRDVVLINPPVYGFSGFKLEYSQPTGLLRISSLLRQKGAHPILIDCLESVARQHTVSSYRRGSTFVPKHHFGMAFDELEERLSCLPHEPEEVYITSFATYWYDATRDTISLLRKLYPSASIIVGGIYSTLMPRHADRTLGADLVVVGEIEEASSKPVDSSHYDSPKYLGIKPSSGCPNNCWYCAQRIINDGKMVFRDPREVCDEIEYWYHTKAINQVYIFSENFLVNRQHFADILTEIVKRGLKIQIGAPKGMEPRLLDKSILEIMKEAGWKGIRLALETTSDSQRKKIGRLHNDTSDYERAVRNATDMGFQKSEIGTFLLYGLPGENLEDVTSTAQYIHSFGGYIIPMAFTPVPGSRIFEEHLQFLRDKDITELAGNLYPFAEQNGYTFEDYLHLEKHFAKLNRINAMMHQGSIEPAKMEARYAGVFSKSELCFAMAP